MRTYIGKFIIQSCFEWKVYYIRNDILITILDKKNGAVIIDRSSHQRCSVKRGVLRNFTKFTGKHLCQSLSFNKLAGLTLFATASL